jgi:peptidoglycan/LPS O-acetylase OafA/YrhL
MIKGNGLHTMKTTDRLPELDWLRVILILAVFVHHVLMPFNGDDWHVMNNQSSKVLDHIMVYFEQIRLQVLFFIAGAGSFILLQKADALTFLKGKLFRLFIPLIIGMMFIVPPQHYYENIGDFTSLFAAYETRIFAFDPKHLWFIEFVIVFMVLAIPFHRLLLSKLGQKASQALLSFYTKKHGLFVTVVGLIVLRCTLKYFFPEQNHSLYNLSVSMFYLFFLFGRHVFYNASTYLESTASAS